MSTLAATGSRARALRRPAPRTLFAALLTASLILICLRTGGGVDLGPMTLLEVILIVVAGLAAALAIAVSDGRRPWGAVTIGAFALLTALTAVSIGWSVEPSDSWLETSRTFAWLAAFVIGAVIGRMASAWWEQLIVAMLVVAVVVSVVALASKVWPAAFDADDIYARLRQPYGYWNAVGLTAALGVPGCLWLGSRRHGYAPLNALAYPAFALLVATMLLAYSRGSLLAAAVGCAAWFAITPLRLRGFAVLAGGTFGGILIALYAFGRHSLKADKIDLALRIDAGRQLGLAILAVVLLELLFALAITFAAARHAPRPLWRRRAGIAVIVVLALIPVGLAVKLSVSDRGLTGSISNTWQTLTNTNATTPANDPSRLSALGSVRSRYWSEAFQVMADHPFKGVGAGGYATARPRYRDDAFTVKHAHGYIAQTAADLGVVGLFASLVLLVAWLLAAARAIGSSRLGANVRLTRAGPAGTPGSAFSAERIGLITIATMVVVFGAHSLIDWTWFVPGNAIPALICAGFIAGRGPLFETAREPTSETVERARRALQNPAVAGACATVIVLALAGAWATMQPWRSVQASDAALAELEQKGNTRAQIDRARELAQAAQRRNPLSAEPLYDLATIESRAGRPTAARKAYEDAIRLQPSNAQTWLRYAEFELFDRNNPERALELLDPAFYLDPNSGEAKALFVTAAQSTGKIAIVPGAQPPPATTTTPEPGA